MGTSARLGIVGAAGLIIGLLALLGFGLASAGGGTAGSRVNWQGTSMPIKERPAAPFTLRLYDGGTFDLESQRGRVAVVNFWASWCEPCRDEAPALEAVHRAFAERGVSFVGVALWDRDEDARAFVRSVGATYPNGPDLGSVAVEYGVRGIPETYFITREGRLVKRWIGPLTEERLVAMIGDLLG